MTVPMEIKLIDQDITIKLRHPKAGERNKALIASEEVKEVRDINGEIVDKLFVSQSRFMIEVLPYCVDPKSWNMEVDVRKTLDNMTRRDYDLILFAVKELFQQYEDDIKKSQESSSQKSM